MNKRRFIQRRKGSWRRFEELLERTGKLRGREPREFSRLFREICGDLAVIRSRGWSPALENYLNHLVALGHNRFYSRPAGNLRNVVHFLAVGYPRLFRKRIGYFVAACILFFVPLGISWAVVQNDPSLAARVVDEELLEMMDKIYDHDPDDPERGFAESQAAMGGFYVWNNVGIALRTFAGGIFCGTLTVYMLLANGISLGAISGYVISLGHGKAFTSFVISHGSFELTAIAIAGGAGLMLGHALVHNFQRTRLEAVRELGLEAVQIATGAAVMLLIAALIEAFWSPSGVPSTVKYIVGAALWVLVYAYLFFAGRER